MEVVGSLADFDCMSTSRWSEEGRKGRNRDDLTRHCFLEYNVSARYSPMEIEGQASFKRSTPKAEKANKSRNN
jgi:hypothetical protein